MKTRTRRQRMLVVPATIVALAMIGPTTAWGGVQSDQDVEPSQSPDSIVFDDDVPMDQRLELTERHARLVEEVRVSELVSEGDTPASAEKKFESEQALSAKQMRERLIELMDNGVSEDAAAASLDLYRLNADEGVGGA